MHEFSVVSALLRLVEREARQHDSRKVTRVHVRVGELAGVEVGLLRSAYAIARADTVCAEAELEVDFVPLRWACSRCGGAVRPALTLRCVQCAAPAELMAGAELLLERIEMEVA